MQRISLLAGTALVIALCPPLFAQSRTIIVPETEVRSGPSDGPLFYPTSKLRRGQQVTVVAMPTPVKGWIAIKPPAPDSFSWINVTAIEPMGKNTAAVSVAETTIRVGSRLYNQEPSIASFKVMKGTQVITLVPERTFKDGTVWVPILPTASEVRYIRADAIQTDAPPELAIASAPMAAAPLFTQPSAMPSGATSTNADPLWAQAQQAERAGNLADAERLYEELARKVMSTDYELALRCLNCSQALKDRQRGTRIVAQPTSLSAQGRGLSIPYAAANSSRPAANPYSPNYQYCYVPDSGYGVRLAPPPVTNTKPQTGPADQWYGPGRLYRTAFQIEGRTAYGLEPANGQHRLYVTAAPGVNLESYRDRLVQLFGTPQYHGELRAYYMTVLKAAPVP
jgi:hypothetical protein